MPLIETLIGPIAALIDKIIPDPKARDAAKLELIKLQGSQDIETLRTQLSAILAEAQAADPWTSRARPSLPSPRRSCRACSCLARKSSSSSPAIIAQRCSTN